MNGLRQRETKGDKGRQKGDKGRQSETKGDEGRQREAKGGEQGRSASTAPRISGRSSAVLRE